MISTHTLKLPPAAVRNLPKVWILVPVVLAVLGYLVLDWGSLSASGFFMAAYIGILLYVHGRDKEDAAPFLFQSLLLTPETIEIGPHKYTISLLRNLHLDVGYYDGEPTMAAAEKATKGIWKQFVKRPAGVPEFQSGTNSRLAFFAGSTKISVPFYIESATQQAQFESLLKSWYTAGIEVAEFSYGIRTYLSQQLNYAEIQAFKEQFGLKEQRPQKSGSGAPKSLPADYKNSNPTLIIIQKEHPSTQSTVSSIGFCQGLHVKISCTRFLTKNQEHETQFLPESCGTSGHQYFHFFFLQKAG